MLVKRNLLRHELCLHLNVITNIWLANALIENREENILYKNCINQDDVVLFLTKKSH
mgnify:CR=1 FL=1